MLFEEDPLHRLGLFLMDAGLIVGLVLLLLQMEQLPVNSFLKLGLTQNNPSSGVTLQPMGRFRHPRSAVALVVAIPLP